MDLALLYARGLGAIFVLIAVLMLVAPAENLKTHGLAFSTYNIAGQAELSAYYTGTALAIGLVLLRAPIHTAMETAIATLGGFVGTRVLCYIRSGVDSNPEFALVQHGMFTAEVIGTLAGIVLLTSAASGASAPRKNA